MTERIPTDVLVERARKWASGGQNTSPDDLLTALATALEDDAAKLARAQGTLRAIQRDAETASLADSWVRQYIATAARERLENP